MPRSHRSPTETDPIVVIAAPSRVLELLRLAVLRSDVVRAVTSQLDADVRRVVDAFAIECRTGRGQAEDLDGAAAALVALADIDAENALVRAARRRGVPIYVAGRALVSDFTPLALVEQRSLAHSAV